MHWRPYGTAKVLPWEMNSLVVLLLLFRFLVDPTEAQRTRMIHEQIEARGVRHAAVLEAMRVVPRHAFVPEHLQNQAYADNALPIGSGQTISQPYIVAVMSEMIEPDPKARILEIGTGSGYQAAILARLFKDVYTIELLPELAARAGAVFDNLKIKNIHPRVGDGYLGWPEKAPFERILLTAAPPEIPQALIDQLASPGRMVGPVGVDPENQYLLTIEKDKHGHVTRAASQAVRFVPMVPGRRGR